MNAAILGEVTMRMFIPMLLAMAVAPAAAVSTAFAQDSAVQIVSYVEVAPATRGTAAGLVRQLANASRKEAGVVRFEILQRIAPSNQFVIVSIWKDKAAYDAHMGSAHVKEFREKIRPHLISAIDDRVHNGMGIGPGKAAIARRAIVVVTHVDVPPPRKDDCIALLKTLGEASTKEAVRFEVFQQTSRPNHFSVVEVWRNQRAYDAHIIAGHTRKFRDELTPMSGALYDERLYRAI
jgi:quinol monooxygenase YgiN